MESDKVLLKSYMKGFNDELDGKKKNNCNGTIKNLAYQLGSIDAIYGDEITSLDYRSDEEILSSIKNYFSNNNNHKSENK